MVVSPTPLWNVSTPILQESTNKPSVRRASNLIFVMLKTHPFGFRLHVGLFMRTPMLQSVILGRLLYNALYYKSIGPGGCLQIVLLFSHVVMQFRNQCSAVSFGQHTCLWMIGRCWNLFEGKASSESLGNFTHESCRCLRPVWKDSTHGMIQWSWKMDDTCTALVFKVGTYSGSLYWWSVINTNYWFQKVVPSNTPNMSTAIKSTGPLARTSFTCRIPVWIALLHGH